MPMPIRVLLVVLGAGVAVHAGNALAGPGRWPFPGAITDWLYLAVLVGGALVAVASVARPDRKSVV